MIEELRLESMFKNERRDKNPTFKHIMNHTHEHINS